MEKNQRVVLGIESTAHTFGVGIVKDGKVLSNIRDSFTTETGGMIPYKVREHHTKVCDQIIKQALEKANLSIKNITLIAYSQGPGMGHALAIGAMTARTLSRFNKIPMIGVNHCIAHQTIGEKLSNVEDAILLYASGANTQIIAYEANKYRVFGETLDTGIGNFLDSFARELGLGFPGGPKIAQLASKGKKLIPIPYKVKGMDVSFSGLFTHCKQLIGTCSNEDLCYSIQETIFAMLVEVAERAMAHTGKKDLILGGGVACNTRLQEMCEIMCSERGAKSHVIPSEFYVDNGAMIAIQGFVQYKDQDDFKTRILPYQRTDDVKVDWK